VEHGAGFEGEVAAVQGFYKHGGTSKRLFKICSKSLRVSHRWGTSFIKVSRRVIIAALGVSPKDTVSNPA
jgi:hypothetical protein